MADSAVRMHSMRAVRYAACFGAMRRFSLIQITASSFVDFDASVTSTSLMHSSGSNPTLALVTARVP